MIFSVYNIASKAYDYYEGQGPKGTHAGAPPKPLLASSSLGSTVEQATWTVPPGAKKIGSGVMPRGRVASLGGLGIGLGGFDDIGGIAKVAAIGAIVYLVGKKVLR